MPLNADFTDEELDTARSTLRSYFGRDIAIHLANRKRPVTPGNSATAISWHVAETNFMVTKTASGRFRGRFFYTPHEQFEHQNNGFVSLHECIVDMLALT
ncbi:MAG: hypothetical protein AAF402_01240 [Pseudomonadota bacterium]